MLRRFTAAVLGILLVLPSFASAATTLTSRAAEAEVTEEAPADTVEILYDSVPRYYEKYCTEESAAVLSGVLKKYTKEDALQLEGDQKVHFCDELSTALSQLKYKKAEVPQSHKRSLVSNIPLPAASKCQAKLRLLARLARKSGSWTYTAKRCALLKTASIRALIIRLVTLFGREVCIKPQREMTAAP